MAAVTNPYSLNDVRSTTDNAVTPYFTTLPSPHTYIADNTRSNVRLILGYAAVSIAGVAFYIEYKQGWEATRSWILPAVVIYFILNSALTLWIWLVEGNQVFEGTQKNGEKIRICSSVQKHSPIYHLHISKTSSTGKVLLDKNISAPFTRWFSAKGTFYPEVFKQWLAEEVVATK